MLSGFVDLDLSVDAKIGSVPVAATAEGQDVLSLDCSDYVIVILEPIIARLVDPADVVTALGRSSLVGDHTHKLIVAGVKTLSVRTVEHLV